MTLNSNPRKETTIMDPVIPEPTNLIINTYPTPKEQLIAGGIALAITAGSAIVIFGGLALVGTVTEKIQKRRNARAAAEIAEPDTK